jgi:exodeoxyribonuclease V alpha subunit
LDDIQVMTPMHRGTVGVSNLNEKDVFNGDIGRIVGIDFDEQEVQVKFDDRLVNYELSDLDDVVLAYAISIHKSQGAEYPAVVVPLLSQHYIMLQRNLLYTAITRAKRLVVLVGSKSAVAIPVRNNKVQHRYTNLGAKLASS